MNLVQLVMLSVLIVCAVVGLLVSRYIHSQKSFYVMEQKAPTLVIVGALCMAYVSAVTMCSGPAVSYREGPFVLLSTAQPGAWLGMIVAVLFVGRRMKAIGCYTMPEYFRRRFNNPNVTFMASIIMVIGLTLYGIVQMVAVGNLLSGVAGLSYEQLIVLFTIALILFSVPAGMWGIMLTDLVMFIVLLAAVFIACPLIIRDIGPTAISALPENFFSPAGLNNNSLVYSFSQFMIWFMFFSCSPVIVSRVFPARNDFAVLKACVISVALISVISTLIYMTGGLMRGIDPSIIPHERVMMIAFTTYPPAIIGALGIAGILVAAISTASLVFNLAGFGLSHDLYQIINGESTNEASGIRRGRQGQFIIISVAGFIAYLNPAAPIDMATFVTGLFSASWLPIIGLSLIWKRMSGKAALYGMLTGASSLIVLQCLTIYSNLELPDALNKYFISIGMSILVTVFFCIKNMPNSLELECHYRLQNSRLTDPLVTEIRKFPERTRSLLLDYNGTKLVIRLTVFFSVLFWICFGVYVHQLIVP